MKKYINILRDEYPFFCKNDLLELDDKGLFLEFYYDGEYYEIAKTEEGKTFEYIDKNTYDRRCSKPEE